MQIRLTLRLDSALIEQARQHAQERGVSLSQLVAEYFSALVAASTDEASFKASLPPITRSLLGVMKDGGTTLEDYKHYLEEKYL